MSIGKFSVNNAVLANILMIAILIFGFLSLGRLPQEQFSEVPFFWVNIIVPYPGVSVEDIERNVTVKIENEYKGTKNLKRIVSTTSEGLSIVRIEFDDGIPKEEFDRLYQEVQTRFNKVELPDGVLDAEIDDFSAADFLPVIEVVLSGNVSYDILNRTAQQLEDELRGVDEVASVNLVGSRDRRLVIKADRQKMEALRLSIDEVVRAIRANNINVPGGILETDNREYLIRTINNIDDFDDLRNIVVRSDRTGGPGTIHVYDIATVTESYDQRGIVARLNGSPAITLRIAKVTGGSSTRVIDRIKNHIGTFSETSPEGIRFTLLNDSTVQIRDSIDTLLSNALIGFILLVVILFVFIGLRNAIMTAIGIPVTFAITFIILELMGETFNTNTLFGLVLVLGLIVDDAIVIVENNYRLELGGLTRREAAIRGTNQVIIPVIASTLTTVAAFLPLMILPGTIGKFLRVIPLTVSIALLASTFEATFFLPPHYAEWPGKVKRRRQVIFEAIRARFKRMIARLYLHRRIVVILLVIVTIGFFFAVPLIRQDLFSAEDFTLFYIDIELPLGSNRSKTEAVVSSFEERLLPLIGNGEVAAINSFIGFASGSNSNTVKSNIAQITVDLSERKEGRKRPISLIMAEIRELCDDISGIEDVQYRKAVNGPPVTPPVSFRIFGNSLEHLDTVRQGIRERLFSYPELLNIRDNAEQGTPELRIRINQNRAEQFGFSTLSIGQAIKASFDGITASSFFKDNREIDIIVTFDSGPSLSIEEMEELKLITPDGRAIPFSSVCTIEQGRGLASIRREDGKREVTIEADAYTNETIRSINTDIVRLFEEEYKSKFPDVTLSVGGEFAEFGDLIFQILRIFLIGLALIYIILATQFKSYSQPFIILVSIPFAFVGVIVFLLISGTPFSTTVLYSGVALAGIAVNDAIVLISFINELKKGNRPLGEAVIEAAETRLRPILLTSVTTIAGLLPTAIGIGGVSVVWGPMASTIVFGLIFSTASTLVFVPCFYGLLYDKKKKGGEPSVLTAETGEP
ncbi:MAG: efflux RND transporter permease subunit [Spirochaetales bacterium]|nr:efflux RND transporter permease subunit [Spirochaetales bacterium]